MDRIKIAIVGVGNCASSLIQGIHWYRGKEQQEAIGIMNWDIQGLHPGDIDTVAAFDIDARKVGKDVHEAIYSLPNCTTVFQEKIPPSGIKVSRGILADGVSDHMLTKDDDVSFVISNDPDPDESEIVDILKNSKAEILINYLPVGSEQATQIYANCALQAGIGFINTMPVFIASDPQWASRFRDANIPIIGDDIKAQLGATIVHRSLTTLCKRRGVKIDRTYQLNTGGNTDFLNMQNKDRLISKKISKTESVQSVAKERFNDGDIHVGPSDYVAWQKDNKISFIRLEGKLFGGVDFNIELRLSVEDSPNSAAIVIDAIRCMKLALDRGIGGVLEGPSSFFCKHPPKQIDDDEAYLETERFITSTT